MNSPFLKFPSTPHLLWLGTSIPRADKVFDRDEAVTFLQEPVVVEEKVDGANLGISFDSEENLLAQNRGNLLQHGVKDQFVPLWGWLAQRECQLFDLLEDGLILFGEWCYARHSIAYTHLPNDFLAFDVFDKHEQQFLCSEKRNQICEDLRIFTVPSVGRGLYDLKEVPRLIGESSLYDGPMEGIYLRQESPLWLTRRAKVVRAEFVQLIGEHWLSQAMATNRLEPKKTTDV